MKRSKVNALLKDDEVTPVHNGVEHIYSTQTVINLGRFPCQVMYESSARVGNMDIFNKGTQLAFTAELSRSQVTINNHTEILNLKTKSDSNDDKTEKTTNLVDMAIKDCPKYFTDETLAELFKDILMDFSLLTDINAIQRQKWNKYRTRVFHEGGLTGYISEVFFNRKIYQSLGMMVDANQAEQSAAEVCLRKLGYLPSVDKDDDFLIQPYRGGLPIKAEGITNQKAYIFTTRLSSDVLQAFIYSLSMMKLPKYYIKYIVDKEEDSEELVDCVCYVDGKLFKTKEPHKLRVAMQLAADEAMDCFGITHPQERMELRKNLHLKKYDYYREEYLDFDRQPSKMISWLWTHFTRLDDHEVCDVHSLLRSIVKYGLVSSSERLWKYQQMLIINEINRMPLFKGDMISQLLDVCVAEIDAKNPNLVTIGNSRFSIKMECKDRKIYSTERRCKVEVLPGHNIRKLKCVYRVALPSLEVHLKAVDCHDLFYCNPAKPVVTSCGVVVLSHDYSASPTAIHVLLQRKTSTKFANTINLLKSLLQKLIRPSMISQVTPAECMKDVKDWCQKDVQLLSEMTMDSLCALMSEYVEYDTRWNELFAQRELPDHLKELQRMCLNELKRREVEGPSEESIGAPWELPQSEFMTRFESIGIHVEESKLCGMRTLVELTGMKISLVDIENCSHVDIPVVSEIKRHRGSLSRFYIWNQIEKGEPKEEEVVKAKLIEDGYELFDKHVIEDGRTRYVYSLDEVKRREYLHKVRYLNEDGKRSVTTEATAEETAAATADITAEETAEATAEVTPDITVEETPGIKTNEDVSITEDKPIELPDICLPGSDGFKSYKICLKVYCSRKKLGVPKYRKNSRKLSCTVRFSSHVYHVQGYHKTVIEEEVAKVALKAIGYLIGPKGGDKKAPGEVIEQIEINDEESEGGDKQAPDESIEVKDDEMENNDGDVEVIEPIEINDEELEGGDKHDPYASIAVTDDKVEDNNGEVEAIEAIEINEDESEGGDKHDPYASIAVTDDKMEENDGEVEVIEAIEINEDESEGGDQHDPYASIAVTDDKMEDNDGEVEVIEAVEINEKESEDVAEEAEQVMDEEKSVERDDDIEDVDYIVLDEIAGEEAEDPAGAPNSRRGVKRKNRRRNRIRLLSDDGYQNMPYSALQGEVNCTPRDVYCERCIWMPLDEAIGACSMLKRISETAEFQEQLNKLVSAANEFLQSKGISETVKQSLLPVT